MSFNVITAASAITSLWSSTKALWLRGMILCAALENLIGVLLSSLLNATGEHVRLGLCVHVLHLPEGFVLLFPLNFKVLDPAVQMLLTGLQLWSKEVSRATSVSNTHIMTDRQSSL